MRFRLRLKTVYHFKLILPLLLLLVSHANAQSQEAKANPDYGIRLTNKTQYFEVIEIKAQGTEIIVRLKNGYEKSIIDFKIALP